METRREWKFKDIFLEIGSLVEANFIPRLGFISIFTFSEAVQEQPCIFIEGMKYRNARGIKETLIFVEIRSVLDVEIGISDSLAANGSRIRGSSIIARL